MAGVADLAAARRAVGQVAVEDKVQAYIVAIVRATRESPSLSLGASPRGATMLLAAAKAWAFLAGKPFVTPDEVKAVAKPALRHRIAAAARGRAGGRDRRRRPRRRPRRRARPPVTPAAANW